MNRKYKNDGDILLIGAYERDNFGDLLFALMTRRALEDDGFRTCLSSVVGSFEETPLHESVHPYATQLTVKKWDAVWVVGGEVGGIGTSRAVHYSLSETFYEAHDAFDNPSRARLHTLLGVPIGTDVLAYVPRLDRYPLNRNTPLFVNSSGGFGTQENEAAVKDTLGAAHISVREPNSQHHLQDLGIFAGLAPDLVHDLPRYYPLEGPDYPGSYIAFQHKGGALAAHLETVCKELVTAASNHRLDIVLVAAGTAKGHDDVHVYRELSSAIQDLSEGINVHISTERDPVRIAHLIGNAAVWVGSSLHGRIISCAYQIPRISLANAKVTHYCQSWDSAFPYDVWLEDVSSALSVALSPEIDPTLPGGQLAQESRQNLTRLLEKLGESVKT